MSGYVCIAMLEDPPYSLVITAPLVHPEEWITSCPLPMHLLVYRQVSHPDVVIKKIIKSLSDINVTAKPNRPFLCKPSTVLNAVICHLQGVEKQETPTGKQSEHNHILIDCPSCKKTTNMEWSELSSLTQEKCSSCGELLYGYRGMARSQRASWGSPQWPRRGNYRGYWINIRVKDMDNSERLISLPKSITKPEIKSKDSIVIVANNNTVCLYNKTIDRQYSIYDVNHKSVGSGGWNKDGEMGCIEAYLILLGFIQETA